MKFPRAFSSSLSPNRPYASASPPPWFQWSSVNRGQPRPRGLSTPSLSFSLSLSAQVNQITSTLVRKSFLASVSRSLCLCWALRWAPNNRQPPRCQRMASVFRATNPRASKLILIIIVLVAVVVGRARWPHHLAFVIVSKLFHPFVYLLLSVRARWNSIFTSPGFFLCLELGEANLFFTSMSIKFLMGLGPLATANAPFAFIQAGRARTLAHTTLSAAGWALGSRLAIGV